MDFSTFVINVLNGLTYGMILFLIASGLNLVFGVLGVLNFAHGSFYMLGAYVAYYITLKFNGDFWMAFFLAPLIVGALGALIEATCLRRVYDKGHAYQILLTFGFVLIFQDLVILVWGMDLKSVTKPPLLEGFVHILNKTFPIYNFFVIALGPVITVALWLLIDRTQDWETNSGGSSRSRNDKGHRSECAVPVHGGIRLGNGAGRIERYADSTFAGHVSQYGVKHNY